ncbi:hypothetical protein NQ176_g7882 [Zarea fungicola]|uniref:Uncharacterized protein n=1 Tax=Zarea fungicola TaxID=93591 RepID=A0ACC1MWK8_9HYPO|nr:hypothetical protein NQ176_g7882 [Lecanicillium fungicola]
MLHRAKLTLTIAGTAMATASLQSSTVSPAAAEEESAIPALVEKRNEAITQAPTTPGTLQERGYVPPDLVGYRSFDSYYCSIWGTYSGYGACCPAGAEYCNNYATRCAGNQPVFIGDRTGKDCGTSFCDTLTVYSNLDGTTAATATMTDVLCFEQILVELDPRTAYKQTFNLKPTTQPTTTTPTSTSTGKPNAGIAPKAPNSVTLGFGVAFAVLLSFL